MKQKLDLKATTEKDVRLPTINLNHKEVLGFSIRMKGEQNWISIPGRAHRTGAIHADIFMEQEDYKMRYPEEIHVLYYVQPEGKTEVGLPKPWRVKDTEIFNRSDVAEIEFRYKNWL